MRTRPPLRNGCSTAFGQLNVGKKSLVLDLKSPDGDGGRPPAGRHADILVENFRPGVMRRLKLDYDTCAAQSEADLLLDLRLWPDRPLGRAAGLCAGDPCGFRLRHGASRLPARPQPAGLLRHLPCRRRHRHLRALARSPRRCISAPDRARPAHRRLDAGIDADPDLERDAVVAICGDAAARARCSARSRPRTAM